MGPVKPEELADVVAELNCGLVRRDADGRILFVNERLLKWLGYAAEELIGRPTTVLSPPELREQVGAEMTATQHGDSRARVSAFQRCDSTTFPVVVLPQALFDEDGRFDGSVAVVVDLGAVQTAKQVRPGGAESVRSHLDRIALELQAIGLSTDGPLEGPSLAHPGLVELTLREKEVLGLLLAGERTPAIAQKLFISPHTVRNHLKAMFRKLDVSRQAELIAKVRSLS